MECLNLLRMEHKSKVHWIPCGKCVNCNINRQNEWVFRLEQETKIANNANFVTLTYNDENIPQMANKDTGEIINTLDYKDVQLYMKRLRKQNVLIIKHYTVGEYGDQTQRPHYHQILFNADSELIQKSWAKGFVKIGTVTNASIRYVTKYMGKRIENTPPNAEKPKNVMSQGLGISYLNKETISHHKDNLIDTILTDGGIKQQLPRYFKQKIFDDYDRMKMRVINEVKRDNDLQYLWDRTKTPERLNFELSVIETKRQEKNAYNERKKQKQSKSLDT